MPAPRIGKPLFRLEMQAEPRDGPRGTSEGWVFLLEAGAGLVKIGRARNAPRGAARDWKPNVLAYAAVPDRYAAETLLHAVLVSRRVVGSRLYRMGTSEAVALMRDHFGEVRVVPQAEQ